MLASARFQSTHPRRVRPARKRPSGWAWPFQSTHPRRVRPSARSCAVSRACCFNPRTHAGCDTNRRSGTRPHTCFNPRTHAGCDHRSITHWSHGGVSIHAPTQGATMRPCHPNADVGFQSTHPRRVRRLRSCSGRANTSFQSTHPRRVRPEIAWCVPLPPCFNPRTHAGCDPNAASFPPTRCSHVSIHAPTQGATIPQHPGGRAGRRFNPRTHAGCDAAQLIGPLTEQEFQSTHPRRVRRWGRSGWPPLAWFQSTHPRRVRRAGVAWYGHTQRVSIHAPTQGATPASPGWPNRSKMFQSTHPRRVRLHLRARIDGFAGVSIHAPTQGATGQHDDRRQDPRVSIHAPTQGAT